MTGLKEQLHELANKPFDANDAQLKNVRSLAITGINFTPQAVNMLTEVCYGLGLTAGWWHDPKTLQPLPNRNTGDLYMLFISEIVESYEAHRRGGIKDDKLPDFDGKVVELADLVIRVFDAIGGLGMQEQFAEAIAAKLRYNTERADHKIENRAQAGGKQL